MPGTGAAMGVGSLWPPGCPARARDFTKRIGAGDGVYGPSHAGLDRSHLGEDRLLVTPQKLIGEPPGRIAPVNELINAYEFESMAERKLDAVTFAEIAGGDRSAFERITFRPRLMIDSTKLDLSLVLFGQNLFTPIL